MNQDRQTQNQAQLLAGVLDSSLDGIMAFRALRDIQGKIINFIFEVVNRRAEEIVGYKAQELLGKKLLDYFPGNVEDGLFDAYVQATETGAPFCVEHHYAHDGLDYWFHICANKCGDGFAVTFSDITGRKSIEDRFRVLFECSTDAHLLFDDTGIIDCNQAAVDMLGHIDKRALMKIHPAELSPEFQPDGRRSLEKCVEMDQTARNQGYHRFDWMHRRKDGIDIPVEVTMNPVKLAGKDALLVVWHDLSERVESEKQIREAVEHMAEEQALAKVGSWQWKTASSEIIWSDEIKRMFGLPIDQPAPSFEEHRKQIHPDDVDDWESVLNKAAEDHQPYVMKFRIVLPCGETRVLESRGRCEEDEHGQLIRTHGTVQDITEQELADQELRLAKERYDLMVSGSSSGIWDWDCATDHVYYSPRFEELIGYKPGELEQTLEAFVSRIHPEDRDHIWQQVVEHLQMHMPYDVEFRLRHKGGHHVWCHAAGQAQWDEQGNPIRMAGSINDISERIARSETMRLNESRLRFALEATSTGLWDWSLEADTVYYSDTWYTMLGYEPNEMPMTFATWESLVHPDDLAPAKGAIEEYLGGNQPQYACEVRMRTKQGQWQWVMTIGEAAEQDEAGKITRIVGLHLDIHAQKTAQEELAQARDIAQKASASKSAFVANMSHEIRTPMNAILGYAELLLDGDQAEADKRNHVHTIRRNGKHLLNLLNDVLDISKIEAGKMTIERTTCKPEQLFADVITLMAPKAAEKGIDLTFEAVNPLPPRVMTDPTRIRQVFINLIGNAIKFTSVGGVQVLVSNKKNEQGLIEMTCEVKDTGIGIEPEKACTLFEPFKQADESTTRKYGGTGLGLTISHNLCDMLGGELTCTSTPGEGSSFKASFKMAIAKQQAEVASATQSKPSAGQETLKGMRILVVEDGPDNQRLIKHFLIKAGAEVDLAENGAVGRNAALQALRQDNPFDLILMDMQMPVLDGYSATRELRNADYSRPIIALTAHASANDRKMCLEAGCDDYLTKPIDRHKLVRTIANHISKAKQEATA